MRGRAQGIEAGEPERTFDAAKLALLFAAYAALILAVLRPALHGDFVSDDLGYVYANPWVHALTLENLRAILDPFGPAATYTANWAPVHLLVNALLWQLFGADTFGWHVVNAVAHAGASVLLIPLFEEAALPAGFALFASLFFLLHPANVEVAAWIFQLKTILALGFGIASLLALRRRPGLATGLFVLALLSKASAGFAVPVAAALAWTRRRAGDEAPSRAGWIALWTVLLALYAAPQFAAFERLGERGAALHPDPLANLRTLVAIGARYLVMAATSIGVAAFQQPPVAGSWLDPWWLAGAALGLAIGARAAFALARGRFEGAFWVFAAAGYAPISQVFPFLYPMGDRYLYFVLPGLLGAAGAIVFEARSARVPGAARPTRRRVAAVAAAALLAVFAVRGHARAAVWRSDMTLMVDAARHSPDGISGRLLRARRAAQTGDAAGAAESLRSAVAQGYDLFDQLDADPQLAPVRDDPRVRAAIGEAAARWIEHARSRGFSTQPELHALARAHAVRGEWSEAVEALERAQAAGGPLDSEVARALAEARARAAEGARDGARD